VQKVVWLVEFYTTWHPVCIAVEPVFAELSLKYGCDCLRFAKVDLGRFPSVSKDMNIDTSGSSKQLPTLIFFEDGKEAARIPHVFSDNSVNKGLFRRKDIIKGFALDEYYAKLKDHKIPPAKKEDEAKVKEATKSASEKKED